MKTIITANERETIYGNITDLLAQYNYDYTSDAIYNIIDTWAEEKADLIAAFKKHPNYVEGQFLIAFDKDWCRKIDDTGAFWFFKWINTNGQEIYDGFSKEMQETVDTWNAKHPWHWRTIYMPFAADLVFQDYCAFAHQFLDEERADRLNDVNPSLKFKEGMKTSRAINKLCTYLGINKLPDYNREFAKYADSVNPLKITRHTIISINPVDYLTMSFGNSWASCHTIDKENTRDMPNSYRGQYSSGTISYMLDKVSMVFYTVDADYNGELYYFQNKINRCMFHYGKDKLIQGRVYPQDNDSNSDGIYKDIREIVQRVMSECLEIPNYWDTRRGVDSIGDYVVTQGTHYPDYHNFSNCCISFPKDKAINEEAITIGHKPICIDCGCEHGESESINHCDCKKVECECCGCIIDEDDARYINGDWYCDDCSYYCEHCDRYYARDNVRWVDYLNGWVCEDCIDEDFAWCDECEQYHRDYNTQYLEAYNSTVCDNCLHDNFTQCDRCDNYVRDRDITFDAQDHSYCPDCWEEICAETENEEEAM